MFFNNFGWQAQGSCCQMEQCSCNKPIIEQPIERCVERNICHKVEHPCPNMPYKYRVYK